MRKRDLEILESLDNFKVLTRDQIASLHFKKNSNPQLTANRVLKRLRLSQHITANTDRSFQQYTYFLNPPPIKVDSQKIDHYLMIAQGYIDLNKYDTVHNYQIEPQIPDADFIPDAYCTWLGKEWFLEFQNTLYTAKQLYAKLERYVAYYESEHWKGQHVLIIGKINFKIIPEDYPFQIRQVKNIDQLQDAIYQLKGIKARQGKTPPASRKDEIQVVINDRALS